MSETWTSLLAALVGAIVGGAASLAGTVLVNRMQMATNARMRLYNELLPGLERAIDNLDDGFRRNDAEDFLLASDQVAEFLSPVVRTSAIAGREERAAAHRLSACWPPLDMRKRPFTGPPFDDHPLSDRSARDIYSSYGEWNEKRFENLAKLRNQLQAFSDYLGAKLG